MTAKSSLWLSILDHIEGFRPEWYISTMSLWLSILDHIEGFWPEWCISTMIQSRDAPFWLETLDIQTVCPAWQAEISCQTQATYPANLSSSYGSAKERICQGFPFDDRLAWTNQEIHKLKCSNTPTANITDLLSLWACLLIIRPSGAKKTRATAYMIYTHHTYRSYLQ